MQGTWGSVLDHPQFIVWGDSKQLVKDTFCGCTLYDTSSQESCSSSWSSFGAWDDQSPGILFPEVQKTKELVHSTGSGLVGLCFRGLLLDKFFTVSRNQLDLGGEFSFWSVRPPRYQSLRTENNMSDTVLGSSFVFVDLQYFKCVLKFLLYCVSV